MDLLFNDLSIHGQLADASKFRSAIGRVMAMRSLAQQYGREIYCLRDLTLRQVGPTLSFVQAIQFLDQSERQSIIQWLRVRGPFWEDSRLHSPDDYLDYKGEVVTDTAVGEAAFCCLYADERQLVSVAPSAWELSPVVVVLKRYDATEQAVDITNHWDKERLLLALRTAPTPVGSWVQLAQISRSRFTSLTFSANAFEPLNGHPFVDAASRRIVVLLDTLNRLKQSFAQDGERTAEGHRLYQEHFTGDKAWFSDSSDTEKNEFRTDLTFEHPGKAGEVLFCTWHGKIKTPQYRIHFSWPIRADEPLYVVYVGPKITGR
jgi:hypothetical protein